MNKVQVINFTIQFIIVLSNIITWSIIGRIIISWLAVGGRTRGGRIQMLLYEITEPFIRLARKIPHKWGMIDFAPLIALIGIDLLSSLLIVFISNV